MKNDLIAVIDFWHRTLAEKNLFPRQLVDVISYKSQETIDLVGPRRAGKSTVMKLLIQQLSSDDHFLYMNFEDPYFLEHNSPQIIEELVTTYQAYFHANVSFLFFDEIHNITSWEKAVRKLRDSGRYHIVVSGSSAQLLSGELATLLTGRHLSHTVFPLSLREYLTFYGVTIEEEKDLILRGKTIQKHFNEYMQYGGFPAVVRFKEYTLLKQYYTDIVERDIINRYDLREKEILKKMGVFLLSSSAKTMSLAAIQKLYTISFELASTYLSYFKDAFLLYELPQFSYSLKTQQKALKKIYAVDTGLANVVSFRFSQDYGRILETAVFLCLLRQKKEIYYYKTTSNKEVDFFVKNADESSSFIQVCWDISDMKTQKREIHALVEALTEQKLTRGFILTNETTDTQVIDGKTILIRPAWQWITESEYGFTVDHP